MFEIQGLYAGYGKKTILKNINLQLPAGKIIALIGPNGCGKSTLLRVLSRLLSPDAGQVLFDGKDIYQHGARFMAKQLALLPQQHIVPEGVDVKTLVGYGRSPYLKLWGNLSAADWQVVDSAMLETGVDALAKQTVSALSGGQQQRVFLAMTLAQQTPVILLDEPTTYLDLNHQEALMKMMRKRQQMGNTVIVVLHDLNQAARYCDYLVVLKAGEVVAVGEPQTVMTETMLKNVFDVDACIYPCPVSNGVMAVLR